jgi:hypothetical protein
VYVERLGVIINPPPTPVTPPVFSAEPPPPPPPFVVAANVPRSDLPAMARMQLRQIREEARRGATSSTSSVARAHWQDIADRVDDILEAKKR